MSLYWGGSHRCSFIYYRLLSSGFLKHFLNKRGVQNYLTARINWWESRHAVIYIENWYASRIVDRWIVMEWNCEASEDSHLESTRIGWYIDIGTLLLPNIGIGIGPKNPVPVGLYVYINIGWNVLWCSWINDLFLSDVNMLFLIVVSYSTVYLMLHRTTYTSLIKKKTKNTILKRRTIS